MVAREAAHPRSRGEHWRKTAIHELANGSSPLARGTWLGSLRGLVLVRLIPARAGNIDNSRSHPFSQSAHPRSRGEHALVFFLTWSVSGSSPLARGTLDGCLGLCEAWRLIPARAGNIGARPQTRFALAAHPRSRGEHYTGAVAARYPGGSSPLARGTFSRRATTR